jgi:hypothetical protein
MTLITSCGPRVQKPDDAFTLVKKERMLSDDSSFVSKEVIQASMKTETIKKSETVDEWTKFRLETEKKIKLNDSKIQKIKVNSDMKASQRRKLATLEIDNNKLKSRLEEYPADLKAKWEAYKLTMSHSANEIGNELNALQTTQKK